MDKRREKNCHLSDQGREMYPLDSCLSVFTEGSGLWMGLPGGSDGKESICNAGDTGWAPGLGRFPWRRKWQPTPVFLPMNPHGQRSLVGYSPKGHKELDMIEQCGTHAHTENSVNSTYRDFLGWWSPQASRCMVTVTGESKSLCSRPADKQVFRVT